MFLKTNIVPNDFDSKNFPRKIEGTGFLDHSNLKILTPKQVPQRLPIILTQLKVVNTCECLFKEIRSIFYSLYGANETTKQVYSSIMN